MNCPIPSYHEIATKIIRTCPLFEGLTPEAFIFDINDNLQAFNEWCKHEFASRGIAGYVYALTVTSTSKDPNVLLKTVERLLEIKCILRIEGNIELTKASMPHIHCTIRCDKYLNKRQVSTRVKDFFCLKKVRGEAGWTKYITKDEADEKLIAYLTSYNIGNPHFLFSKKNL
ncbi:MAG: Rep protein [Circoviridae sp.]|nr:MAG: Rep protein [Circoviridae sp.]